MPMTLHHSVQRAAQQALTGRAVAVQPLTSPILRLSRAFATGPPPPKPVGEPMEQKSQDAAKAAETHTEDEAPPTGSLRQRLRTIMRRYGWWALGIYFLMSIIDCGLTFAAIHFYGGENVRELERVVRDWVGLAKKEEEEPAEQSPDTEKPRKLIAADDQPTEWDEMIARLSTEFVLAYGIHKTILLPVRAGVTAAITPAVVRWLIRRGWARPIKAAATASAAGAKA